MSDDIRQEMVLFGEKGPRNTMACFEAVADRIEGGNINHVVVASTSGETGVKALKFFEDHDVKIVVVTHQFGYKKDGKCELEAELRRKIEESDNGNLVVTPDVLTRVPKIVRGRYGGFSSLGLIADSLRIFSEGIKVCVECTIQAADSGEIPAKEEIAAVAGTAEGADTAVIIQSQHSHHVLDTDIREILCIPRER